DKSTQHRRNRQEEGELGGSSLLDPHEHGSHNGGTGSRNAWHHGDDLKETDRKRLSEPERHGTDILRRGRNFVDGQKHKASRNKRYALNNRAIEQHSFDEVDEKESD